MPVSITSDVMDHYYNTNTQERKRNLLRRKVNKTLKPNVDVVYNCNETYTVYIDNVHVRS